MRYIPEYYTITENEYRDSCKLARKISASHKEHNFNTHDYCVVDSPVI